MEERKIIMRNKKSAVITLVLLSMIAAGGILMFIGSCLGAERYIVISPLGVRIESFAFGPNVVTPYNTSAPLGIGVPEQALNAFAYEMDSLIPEDWPVYEGGNFIPEDWPVYYTNIKLETIDNLDAFSDIDIVVKGMTVTLNPSDHYGIHIQYPNDRAIVWTLKRGLLTVEDQTKNFYNNVIVPTQGYVVIYCPANKLDSIRVSTVSGDIKAEGYIAKDFTITTVSGSITVDTCAAENDFTVGTVSGSIMMKDCVSVNKIAARATSGSIGFIRGGARDIYIKSTSGSISYETGTPQNQYDIVLSTVSGSVSVNDSYISKKDLANYRVKDAAHTLTANTVSGNIQLKFNL
jgi:hypothetical protein